MGGDAPSDPYALPGRAPVEAAAGASGEQNVPEAGSRESHFPLVDGATFTYRHTSLTRDSWNETATLSATRYQGADAFVLAGEEDSAGEQTQSTLLVRGSGVYRVYKETRVGGELTSKTTYEPAFLRYDEAWTRAGISVTLEDDWSEVCGDTSTSCAPGSVLNGSTTHVYTVLELADEVSVPAGDFTAVKVQRDNPDDRETKLFWFSLGVGKVREENPANGAIEELAKYSIP